MKKITLFLILISGIILLHSCKKVETDPVLDMSAAVAPAITSPSDGASFELKQEDADQEITIEWSAAQYNLTELAYPTYVLQAVPTDGSFEDAVDVSSSVETSLTTTIAGLNNMVVSMGLTPDQASNVKWRVIASLRGFENGGRIIGQLERALIFLFVIVNQPSAIGSSRESGGGADG